MESNMSLYDKQIADLEKLHTLEKVSGQSVDSLISLFSDDGNTPVYDSKDAIRFIAERCDVDGNTINKILMLDLDYMRSIGLLVDEEVF